MPLLLFYALFIYILFGIAIGLLIAYPVWGSITIIAISIIALIHDIKTI